MLWIGGKEDGKQNDRNKEVRKQGGANRRDIALVGQGSYCPTLWGRFLHDRSSFYPSLL
jgi:hypothetical protein